MKRLSCVALIFLFVLAACQYVVPLSEDHNINIDSALLGHWAMLPDQNDPGGSIDSMTILQFSETEYLINYVSEGSGMFFRAYLIEAGEQTLLQLQLLGTDEGPAEDSANEHRYIVARYVLQQDRLEITTLNTELVSRDLMDSESLMQAYLANLDNPELFTGSGLFIQQ